VRRLSTEGPQLEPSIASPAKPLDITSPEQSIWRAPVPGRLIQSAYSSDAIPPQTLSEAKRVLMSSRAEVLYGTPTCPVCVDSGALICLKSKEDLNLIFYCPLCGLACTEIPRNDVITDAEIFSLDQLAPSGVDLPTLDDITTAGLRLQELPSDLAQHWMRWLITPDPRTPGALPVIRRD
jgi:hypothetical protein